MSLASVIAASRRRVVSAFDADATDYFARVAAAGSDVSSNNRAAVNDLVLGLKSDSIWADIDLLVLLAGPDDLAGSLIALKGANATNAGFASSEHVRATGIKGNGSSYLNSNYNPNDFSDETDRHFSFGVTESIVGNGRPIMGNNPFANNGNHATYLTAGIRWRITGGSTDSALTHAAGFYGFSRDSGTSSRLLMNSNAFSSTNSSQASVSLPYYVFTANVNGSPSTPVLSRLSYYTAGGDINLTKLRDRLTAYMAAIT